MTSASVTDTAHADTADGLRRGQPASSGATVLHDAAEAALRQRARRQGLLLMIASAAAMIAVLVGIWLSFR